MLRTNDPAGLTALLFPCLSIVSLLALNERAAQSKRQADLDKEKAEREARKASKRASKPKRPTVQPSVQSTVQSSVQGGQRVAHGGRVQDVQDADLDAVNAQRAATKEEKLDKMLDILLDTPDIGATELAGQLDVSRSTVYNYQSELEAAGRIRKNGQGVEVVQ